MYRITVILAALAAMFCAAGAQSAGGGSEYAPTGTGNGPPPSDQEVASGRPHDVENTGDYLDRAQLLSGRNAAKELADAKVQSAKLVSAMQLNCEITDAEPVGRGKAQLGGGKVSVNIYEVACSSGLGFILVSRSDGQPYATSCFSADKTHAAEVAAGRKSDMYCQLPANKDVNAMATSLLAAAGTKCAVQKVLWYGRSLITGTEYTEAACADGHGYVLHTAQAGSTDPTSIINCQEALERGIQCHLSGASSPPSNH